MSRSKALPSSRDVGVSSSATSLLSCVAPARPVPPERQASPRRCVGSRLVPSAARTSRRSSARPVWLVLIAIGSVQFGAALAKLLFDEATPTTVVWLRLLFSALVMLAVARPSLAGREAG